MKTSTNKPNEEVRAFAKNIRMSAHKVRRVMDQIRGRPYAQAYILLKFLPYKACYPIFQLLNSAAANAKNNMSFKKELFVSRAEVNEATSSKRFHFRAKGRSFCIRKQTCHITIVLKQLPEQ
uniref:Large ribosomal subunit protein uL22c n=2 Tax=Welwitschia mirabilis TaxID=3377 RepID=RK22_WELMI|nr:ribosomal protein L22 [Welwitschia mirabilis]B2Y1Z9.1 RecName: Full=Large ribosomal subunit protein uL22c; AltName: Full=50S ribosomal protein L22, chloroplastic [Welwitschia mirabilis]ABY26829.1 ribosomal protein L22 [Welwitschia mirabilis]AMA21081.1 ribosomal protein L22 [Welwitschia mirabilis]BAH11189.1 ribosomal protein L22 [Welwitschia mirabilis]